MSMAKSNCEPSASNEKVSFGEFTSEQFYRLVGKRYGTDISEICRRKISELQAGGNADEVIDASVVLDNVRLELLFSAPQPPRVNSPFGW